MEADERRHLGSTFDLDAAGYDAGRPEYPAAAWAVILDHLDLDADSSVLEIGPGTGQATGRLLATGAAVHAVEPGAALADLLRDRHADTALTVDTTTFEDATLSAETFDAAVSATAFHWVEPDVGIPRLRTVLVPGGRVALWWMIHRDPDAPVVDPVDEVVRTTTHLPNRRGLNGILDELDLPRRFVDHGFADVEWQVVRWTITHDEASLLALFRSFSDMRKRTTDEQQLVYDRLAELVRASGGTIDRPATIPILTARAPD